MLTAFKAELRKLITVRSTLFVLLLASLFTTFVAYQIARLGKSSSEIGIEGLTSIIQNLISLPALAGSIIVALLVLHEYRYNTITYALASTRRVVFFFAKLFAAVIVLIVTHIVGVASIITGTWIGLYGSGTDLFAGINVTHLAGVTLFYVVAFGLTAVLLAFLIRHAVGTFALLFLMPGTIEQLLSLAIKGNAVYLPFTVLGRVVGQTPSVLNPKVVFSPGEAATLFTVYLIVFGAITCLLFIKRDAN